MSPALCYQVTQYSIWFLGLTYDENYPALSVVNTENLICMVVGNYDVCPDRGGGDANNSVSAILTFWFNFTMSKVGELLLGGL